MNDQTQRGSIKLKQLNLYEIQQNTLIYIIPAKAYVAKLKLLNRGKDRLG